jgi:hypothetical protein
MLNSPSCLAHELTRTPIGLPLIGGIFELPHFWFADQSLQSPVEDECRGDWLAEVLALIQAIAGSLRAAED